MIRILVKRGSRRSAALCLGEVARQSEPKVPTMDFGRSAAAGGIQATARLLGQTTGAIIMSLLFTLTSVDEAPRIGLGIAAALSLASMRA